MPKWRHLIFSACLLFAQKGVSAGLHFPLLGTSAKADKADPEATATRKRRLTAKQLRCDPKVARAAITLLAWAKTYTDAAPVRFTPQQKEHLQSTTKSYLRKVLGEDWDDSVGCSPRIYTDPMNKEALRIDFAVRGRSDSAADAQPCRTQISYVMNPPERETDLTRQVKVFEISPQRSRICTGFSKLRESDYAELLRDPEKIYDIEEKFNYTEKLLQNVEVLVNSR